MMRYVATIDEDGDVTGFWRKAHFENAPREVFVLDGERVVEFDGPDDDGTQATFDDVARLARAAAEQEADSR